MNFTSQLPTAQDLTTFAMRLITLAVQCFTKIALWFFATLLVTIMMMDVYSRIDTLFE
jgi:hypothetical protein